MIDIKLEKCMVKPLMNLLKFFPDWFVASKIIKKLLTALYADDNILHFNEDSANALFVCNTVGNFSIDPNNINLGNYDEDHPETVIHIRVLAWHIKLEKHKAPKKSQMKN